MQSALDYKLQRPPLPRQGGYPTQKPFDLIEQIVKQSTKVGDSVLDLFGGSGVMLNVCLKLKRFIHTMDISDEAIDRMMTIAKLHTQRVVKVMPSNNQSYSDGQLDIFKSGVLF